MSFEITVSGFANGGNIPQRHTCEGEDVSPAIRWQGAPDAAQGLVLIVDDPDAPVGTWNHWLLYDIPATTQALAEGGSAGQSGTNDFGRTGYGGPCPPPGHGPHRYFFKIFALNTASLGLPAGASRADLDQAMRGKILGEAQYMGRYERR
jgi:Raf kinase inhibitor-like YbhB/YbcL family protein